VASRGRAAAPWPGWRRGHPGPRQAGGGRRRVRHRLRRHPQQLLPAGHARAHGALGQRLGVGSGGVRLPPRRLPADRPGGDAQGRREDLRGAAGDRLPLGAGRGGARLPRVHAGAVRRLAGARHHRDPARAAGRLRQQRPLAARAGRQGRGRGGADRHRDHRHRDRHQRRRGEGGGDRSGADRLRAAGDRGRPVGPRPVGHARPAVTDPGDHARRHSARRPADVDLLGAAGGDAGGRPGGVHHRRGRAAAGRARRLRRPALRRLHRRPHHRPDVGDLLQAGLLLRRGPGRYFAVRGRRAGRGGRRRSLRPGEPGVHGDRGLRPDVDRGAGALPRAVRAQAPPVPA
jgi:hypothetical protein